MLSRLVLSLWLVAAASHAQAAAKGEDFTVFLRKFVASQEFRALRIATPLQAELTDACGDDDPRPTEWWSHLVAVQNFTPPLGSIDLAREGLEQQITEVSSQEIRLFQYQWEADSYLLTYTFRLRHGRWYLVKYEDSSC